MQKIKKVIFPLLFSSLLLNSVGCNNKSSSNGSNSQSESTSESITTSQKEEYSEVGILKNYIKNMNLKGYVGTNLKNNIKYWQTNAYHDNKNIITQIKLANQATGAGVNFASVLGTDFFGVDSFFDIDIVEKDGKKCMGWKMKAVPGGFSDRDIRYINDPNADTKWVGAKELWVNVDASEISKGVSIRIALEDDSYGRESFALIPGVEVKLYNGSSPLTVKVEDGGFVPLPAGFIGYIAIPLNLKTYERYWNEGGDGGISLEVMAQFQMAVKCDSAMLDKSVYFKEFGVAGEVNGKALPVGNIDGYTYKKVWGFDNVAKKDTSQQGSSLAWYGEFVGKLLTGIAYSYKAAPDEQLKAAANEIVDDLYDAQGEDGYLGVFTGKARYSIGASNWDLWNQYHCVVGLLEWYKITGNEKALEIAIKTCDCILEAFQNRSYLVKGGFETNRGIAHGFAMLYQTTKDKKYLDEAEKIIMRDCQDSNGWYKSALRGGHFYTSSSARWEVLHMIMTLGILYEETQNGEYLSVMDAVWYSILATDIHNDGGFTTNEGAVGDPYMEGVIETCCTIAWSAFTNEYYKYVIDSQVADELERSYFNALLGSLLDDDKYCTYNTPVNGIRGTCGTYDGRRVKSQQDISFQFNYGSPDMNCCQANFARGIGQLAEWAVLTDGDALYVNYYGNCEMETSVNGTDVKIKQTTSYPVNGKIKFTVDGLKKDTYFSLNLRVPSWAKSCTLSYDGETRSVTKGEYCRVGKIWKNGDTVELDIGIGFTAWRGERRQQQFTSVYYGPILLALDEYFLKEFDETKSFSREFAIDAFDFEKAEVSNGASYGAWLFVDVDSTQGKIRLVDFASAGKFNGSSNPSSYYSWLFIENPPEANLDPIERWKQPLY